ncbi:hypothetical protein ACFSTA_09185 [Ornithinibacillus salinisoli]|uniref:Uncharacterized protein n=1 Tax=Ornithinibacillus salinisoli TaxID=1848459 RepID=A0ABW4VY67_9BACI
MLNIKTVLFVVFIVFMFAISSQLGFVELSDPDYGEIDKESAST